VKAAVGEAFYESASLVCICRFNFLLRRTFIQWLHGDLRAIGAALAQLENVASKWSDCRRAGLSSKELIPKLRQFHEHWKPPFQNDYSQDSAFQPYEQLMCLREDLEEALGPATAPTVATSAVAEKKESGPDNRSDAEPVGNTKPSGGRAPVVKATVPPSSGKSGDPTETAARLNSVYVEMLNPLTRRLQISASLTWRLWKKRSGNN